MCLNEVSLEATYQDCQNELVDAGLLVRLGIPGVYGLSGKFEDVIERFERYVTRMGSHLQPEVIRFPPLLGRHSYQATDHLETFPNLMGSVHSFTGNEKAHLELIATKASGEDWSRKLEATDVMMTPAACYPDRKSVV